MEKVKLTREQAEAIDSLHKTGRMVDVRNHAHGVKWTNDKYLPLNELNLDEFIRAVYIGYEIEPDFKVGDWVVTEFEDYGIKVAEIYHISFNIVYARWQGVPITIGTHVDSVRHATTEEIKAEQERRVWAKIGREPGVFMYGDVVVDRNGTHWCELINMRDLYKEGSLQGFHPVESFIEFGGGE